MLYKITGVDVLESTEIKCKWIPVFPVYGDEIDIEGKVIRAGIIRNAKGPCQQYNVFMTSATEEVLLRTKAPYIMAEGQDEGWEDEWEQANSAPFRTAIQAVSLDGKLAPPPQRQPMADVPAGLLALAMHASDNIKKTTGLFDASSARAAPPHQASRSSPSRKRATSRTITTWTACCARSATAGAASTG
jgi:hypothetical protein